MKRQTRGDRLGRKVDREEEERSEGDCVSGKVRKFNGNKTHISITCVRTRLITVV